MAVAVLLGLFEVVRVHRQIFEMQETYSAFKEDLSVSIRKQFLEHLMSSEKLSQKIYEARTADALDRSKDMKKLVSTRIVSCVSCHSPFCLFCAG